MTGIAEMFAELADDQRAHYEMQLELWAWYRRTAESDRLRAWRAANAERIRAYDRARRPPKPRPVKTPDMCRDCYAPRVPGRASCADHLAKARARAARRAA